jgi:hypothetical protein
MENAVEWIGWIGAAFVLGGYGLISFKKIPADGLLYHGLNIAGSVLLAAYAHWHGAIASVAINIIWSMIGIWASFQIVRAFKK